MTALTVAEVAERWSCSAAHVTPHALRHTAAVWMAEAGVPMPRIAAFLGHSNSRITEERYARFAPDHLREAAEALEIGRPQPFTRRRMK